MKALMGKLAEAIRNDSKGRKDLREFIYSGGDEKVITLDNGKKYKVSRNKPVEARVKA